MTLKQKYEKVVAYFSVHNPDAGPELHFKNPFQLLVAVVLSAQCTDKRVNMVTPALFEAYPTPEMMAQASVDALYEKIKSVSYPNNKAKHLKGLAEMLVRDFQSEVPQTLDELQRLPGVGRKTANVILAVIFSQPTMAVDTHVFRVAHRIGLVNAHASTPLETEKQLVKHIPEEKMGLAHHWLILHGRYVCQARKPQCENCGLTAYCNYFQKRESEL
ncbi:MAG: endonuclease III [Bacteroidales bacterium]|nr:endonuclease III [Bacteroidales bacterium]